MRWYGEGEGGVDAAAVTVVAIVDGDVTERYMVQAAGVRADECQNPARAHPVVYLRNEHVDLEKRSGIPYAGEGGRG